MEDDRTTFGLYSYVKDKKKWDVSDDQFTNCVKWWVSNQLHCYGNWDVHCVIFFRNCLVFCVERWNHVGLVCFIIRCLHCFYHLVYFYDVALFFKDMDLTYENQRLLVKNNLVYILTFFLVDDVSVDLPISAGIDLNPRNLLINIYLLFRIKFR